MALGSFKVEGDNNGRVYLTIEISHREKRYDMSPDTARRIGESLLHAAKWEAMQLTLKRGDYAIDEK